MEEFLWAKGHGSGRSYPLSDLLLHLDWRSQLCHLFNSLAGQAAIFPQHVVLRVGGADDGGPVIGSTWWNKDKTIGQMNVQPNPHPTASYRGETQLNRCQRWFITWSLLLLIDRCIIFIDIIFVPVQKWFLIAETHLEHITSVSYSLIMTTYYTFARDKGWKREQEILYLPITRRHTVNAAQPLYLWWTIGGDSAG